MVRKELVVWPTDKKTYPSPSKEWCQTWSWILTLFPLVWLLAIWSKLFFPRLLVWTVTKETRLLFRAKLWSISRISCTNWDTNDMVTKWCTMGSQANVWRSWSSSTPPTISDSSIWLETKSTREVEVPLRFSPDSQLRVELVMEDFVLERWRETAWSRMELPVSSKNDCLMCRIATVCTFAIGAVYSAKRTCLSSSTTAEGATRLRTSAKSRSLTLASFFCRSWWRCRSSLDCTPPCSVEQQPIEYKRHWRHIHN